MFSPLGISGQDPNVFRLGRRKYAAGRGGDTFTPQKKGGIYTKLPQVGFLAVAIMTAGLGMSRGYNAPEMEPRHPTPMQGVRLPGVSLAPDPLVKLWNSTIL